MRALCVVGSPSPHSHTRALVLHIAALLERRGFTVTLADLAERELPHSRPEHYWSGEPHPVPAAREFVAAARDCDAVVLGTPVYHAGYSGLLKNALDLLPYDAFDGKAVGLAANAGGPRGSAGACEQLRQVVKALGGWPVPAQVSTVAADFAPGADERPALDASGPLHDRCAGMADQLAAFTRAMRKGTAGTEGTEGAVA
ncbi:NAD(P)H-dependent oxidoreductase [Streptomyces triculaminicus]|uniref:NAD(P)H-dependent oxidoreductase n=2 Tax=Streptomyces TaxID=1883 RepID=A0A939FM79_9ACTN|nr:MULTISPECIES: NADPH-dependent FMN reductase [Streptomyces]MBO0652522.1 NAD(P)H-dependent oxidoreductase [Streptomyces triculaminicus]QSY51878.1 NAD(P)H-dependent oxidoreductase [Streptomyces griseocarneus]